VVVLLASKASLLESLKEGDGVKIQNAIQSLKTQKSLMIEKCKTDTIRISKLTRPYSSS